MANNKHLSLSERNKIEQLLNARYAFKAIGRELNKDCTTVSKEVKNHIQFKKSGCIGKAFNDCVYRPTCSFTSLCTVNNCGKKLCKVCSRCHLHCSYYSKESCSLLLNPPYVCNGCEKLQRCTLEKHIYSADYAQNEYHDVLRESRSGI